MIDPVRLVSGVTVFIGNQIANKFRVGWIRAETRGRHPKNTDGVIIWILWMRDQAKDRAPVTGAGVLANWDAVIETEPAAVWYITPKAKCALSRVLGAGGEVKGAWLESGYTAVEYNVKILGGAEMA